MQQFIDLISRLRVFYYYADLRYPCFHFHQPFSLHTFIFIHRKDACVITPADPESVYMYVYLKRSLQVFFIKHTGSAAAHRTSVRHEQERFLRYIHRVLRVMRIHYRGKPALFAERGYRGKHFLLVFKIQIRLRLVKHKKARLSGKCARYENKLVFAAAYPAA